MVSLTLLAVCTLAAFVGSLLPLVARRVGVDPAVMSAPFITTLVDAIGPGPLLPDRAQRARPVTDLERCPWAGSDPLYLAYHDTEWGVPIRDPHRLFELLCLEGAQAGLSWITILRRREGYRAAFDGFDARRIAAYTDADRDRLLADVRIVRNRAKVAACIGNARAWLEVADPVQLLWSFVGGAPVQNRWRGDGRRSPQPPMHHARCRRRFAGSASRSSGRPSATR